MNRECITADGKVYPLRIRENSGKRTASRSVRLTVGKDCRIGRQIQHIFTGKTAEEVQQEIDAACRLSDEQLQLRGEDSSLEQLAGEWLKSVDLCVRKQTGAYYRKMLRARIFPYFTGKTVRSIREGDIRAWQEKLRREGVRDNCAGNLFTILQAVMEFGCQKGYLHCNPCRYARACHAEETEQPILTEAQLYRLLVEEKEHPLAGLFAVTLLLGLRISEASGLSWKQVDLEKRTVVICQQGTAGRKIAPYTKTGRNRTLRMPESAALYFMREKERQRIQAEHNPGWSNTDDLVFTDRHGRMRLYDSVRAAFIAEMEGTVYTDCH